MSIYNIVISSEDKADCDLIKALVNEAVDSHKIKNPMNVVLTTEMSLADIMAAPSEDLVLGPPSGGVPKALSTLLSTLGELGEMKEKGLIPEDFSMDEEGDYRIQYFSESHHKLRYFVGPPLEGEDKPRWSYAKKDAANLSQEACKVTCFLLAASGYDTPMDVVKIGPSLSVIEGGKEDPSTNGKGSSLTVK